MSLIAQENRIIRVFISTKTEIIGGKKYYLHTVEQGQTLYSISVAYNVPLEEIARENAIVNNLIGVGEELRIPFVSSTVQSEPLPSRDSSDFIMHTVSRGETLYGLSRQYGVDMNEIIRLNPEASNGLRVGETLRIPKNETQHSETVTAPNPDSLIGIDTSKFIIHVVQRRETLFSISNLYAVTISDILNYNPEAEEGIRYRQVLIIPKATTFEGESIFVEVDLSKDTTQYLEIRDSISCAPIERKKTLNIALLMPLRLDEVYGINTNFSGSSYQRDRNQNAHTLEFIQFYQGFSLALDSLKLTGISLNLHVFDVGEDVSQANEFVNNPQMKNLDMIFGPFHATSFAVVADFAKNNNIKLINPLITSRNDFPSNGNLFNISPTPKLQLEEFVKYLKTAHKDNNVIIVHYNTQQERRILDIIKSSWIASSGDSTLGFKEVLYNQTGQTGILNNIVNDKTNVVFCLSSNEASISNFIRKLSDVQDENNRIVLFGLPNWQSFTTLDLEYLQKLQYHYFTPVYINYTDTNVLDFIIKFREKYAIEPDAHAFKGYDMAMFFLFALNEYGPAFSECINYIPVDLMDSRFKFIYNATNASYNNIHLNILKYDYFTIKREEY